MLNNPKISFVIPILNSGDLLKDCFDSIERQNYPKTKIEIICPDGGSIDNGPKIAIGFGAKVIKNPKVLAEPGFMLGAQKATGDFIVYMGADNRLVGKNWIKKIIIPFEDEEIIAAYPWHNSTPKNTWLTRYFNAFTDPINHFVMQDACNPLYFNRAYKILKKTKDYIVYDFSLNNFPMLAFDQGFIVRPSYKRPDDTEYDDILPVLDMIKKGLQIAFVPAASNYHDTLEKGLPQFVKKMRWGIDNNLAPGSLLGYKSREDYTNLIRRICIYLWPFYAVTIFLPLLYSIFGFIRDKKKEWAYHLPITFLMLLLVVFEVIRVKILGGKSLASRQ